MIEDMSGGEQRTHSGRVDVAGATPVKRSWSANEATGTPSMQAAERAQVAGATTAEDLLAATKPSAQDLMDAQGQAAFASPVPPTALQAKGGKDLFAGGANLGDKAQLIDQTPLAPDPSSAVKHNPKAPIRTGIVGPGQGGVRAINTAKGRGK